ncbi:MAG TPA: hypothetical protein VMU71_03710 [Terracidiphilus sp.]|nr:hypothetical protein [Terracidiphilus sp.]
MQSSALVLLLVLPLCCAAQDARPLNAPLPDPMQLLNRAIANEKKTAAEQERYECRVTDWGAQTDKNGKIKHEDTTVSEQFYVNGQQIERTLEKNGKPLTPDQARKEDQRVMKATLKYSDKTKADKETAKNNQEAAETMSAMMLTNGHRELVNGRNVLFYDIVPNPQFKPKNLTQHFASVMQGKVSIDEESGEVIDFDVHSVKDVKIAGGVLASLHKGFWLHIHNTEQPDGVWLNDLAEGTGDARAALFFHPYFRFRERTGDCHLYNATAQQVGTATVVKK